MKSIYSITRGRRVLAGGACALLGLLGLMPWQAMAQRTKPTRILFVSNRDDAKRFNIYAMNPDGSHITRLTRGDGMEADPAWSPDGRRIAFDVCTPQPNQLNGSIRMNLCIMNADGTGRKQLTHLPYGMGATSPAWSPDGKRLVFTVGIPDDSSPMGIGMMICTMNADGTGGKRLRTGMFPTWSPDGKSLIYSIFGTAAHNHLPTLYEMNADGHHARKLRDNALQGVLSPDGSHLAYIVFKDESPFSLWVSRADGSQPRPLTGKDKLGAIGPQWSADGKRIFYSHPFSGEHSAQNSQICVIAANGGPIQNLTRGDAPDYLGSAPGLLLMVNWIDHLATAK